VDLIQVMKSDFQAPLDTIIWQQLTGQQEKMFGNRAENEKLY
jgi:hypothetical protein